MIDKILNSPYHASIEASLVLLILVFLEAVLSADNAIALAAIAQGLEDKKLEAQALNIGLVFAYVLRIGLILTATWVQQFWQFDLLGGAYLLWLVFQHFTSQEGGDSQHLGPRFNSLWQAIPVIALTDLAFSLDSVTTAIAVSQVKWLVLTGATIGIVTLRFMAGLFIRWLDEYVHLADAGYITVALVGLRLVLKVVNDTVVPPEWLMIGAIALLFLWGFSQRVPDSTLEATEATENLLVETPETSEVPK